MCELIQLWVLGAAPAYYYYYYSGRQMIQQRNPSSTCHRFRGAVSPHKFDSPQREQILCQSRQLLHVMAEWEELFQEKFFPRFATRSGFG